MPVNGLEDSAVDEGLIYVIVCYSHNLLRTVSHPFLPHSKAVLWQEFREIRGVLHHFL
jgi:hypothetical protein